MMLPFKYPSLIAACLLTVMPPGSGLAHAADQVAPENPSVSVKPSAPLPDLIGLSTQAVEAYLGAPDFQRTENGAQDWLYTKDGCVLHVFLIPTKAEKATGTTARVVYVDAFPADPENVAVVSDEDRRRCLARFLDQPLKAGPP